MSTPYGNDPYGQQPPNPYGGGGAGGASFGGAGGGGFQEPAKTDGVSVAALVLGLLCCTSPISLVLGFVGLKRTKGGQRKGRGMAITGLILGILGVLMYIGLGIALAAGVAWFDSLVQPDEAKVGQCIDVDDDDDNAVLLYEKECSEDHDGEIVAVAEVDDENRDTISNTMADFCATLVSPEDLVKLSEVEGLEFAAVIEDPEDVSNGDHLVCYVTSDDKLDKKLL
ncbi:DUF4190 domain-containing protein [Nocardioides stalactiti]|uniref:DUF4190 domain-containing protein n=1 Tax=Nocardioides stalactiti TaxID=2755356 RepID=UPI0016023EE3|nr:DUF4190 domain-containing protein [Nocardioides stalactiti]